MNDTSLARRQLLAGGAALGLSGCGFILYPSRRGRTGGNVDLPVLIIDLLWLIPGLIPGAVCLIVDFTTGCIYRGGGRGQTSSPPSPAVSQATRVDVVVDGEVVASAAVGDDRQVKLEWRRQLDEAVVLERARVVVQSGQAVAHEAVRAVV